MPHQQAQEVRSGDRFAFGANWAKFLTILTDDRIRRAEQSLLGMLEADSLAGLTFLDIGSGSGLFSLAARRLGAEVHSFDYDAQSVACTAELRRRYFSGDALWRVESGSVLDSGFMNSLPQFDIVYSWGVLHHTGAMTQALENAADRVAPGGRLFIAIYNDQGGWSRRWRRIKRVYNKIPGFLRPLYTLLVMGPREAKFLALATLKGRPWIYFDNIVHYSERSLRGMSYWHDLIDWVGGYPFEVAKPEEIFDFYRDRGFALQKLKTSGGSLACNEFVFRKNSSGEPSSS